MAVTPVKALLFLLGGTVAAGATAYVSGAFDQFLVKPPATLAAVPEQPPAEAAPKDNRLPGAEPPGAETPPADVAAAPPSGETDPAAASAPAAPADASAVVPPSFDIVRVEADGSVVIAGKAAPNSKVELLAGSKVLGEAVAGPDGDFAVVLEEQLKPGDYQIVLRATAPGNVVAMSVETAIVSIPESKDGEVLAMVEQPGKPAEMISVPAGKPADAATPPASGTEAAVTPPAEAKPAEETVAAAPAEPATPPAAAPGPKVAVEAVEIEGKKVFVAGAADPGRKLRGYANDILLGDTVASPEGRFLIEAEKELPVGTYTIRVDALDADGQKVVVRAAVPFEREPGESIAAVAPPAPEAPATLAEEPPAVAEAPAAPAESAPGAGETITQNPPTVAGESPPAGEAVAAAPAAERPAAPQNPPATAEATQPAPDTNVAAAPAEGAVPPSSDAPEVTAPKLQAVDGAVIIRRGDTLWRISRRVYGKGVRYSTIYLANQTQITDPDRIWPGQVFKVPDKSDDGAPADMKVMGDQATTVQ